MESSGSEPAASTAASATTTTNPTTMNDAAVAASQSATTQPQQQQQQQQQVQQQQQQAFMTQTASAVANPTVSTPPSSAQAPPATKAGARGGAAAAGGDGAVKKVKAPRKNAKSSDPTGIGMPKKPSPRARTPKAAKAATAADGGEAGAGKKKMTAAEKKKAAAAAAALAAQNTPQTSNGVPEKRDAPAAEPPAMASTPVSNNAELLPSQDNDLRKAYLQQIYRQLQITHRDQDDSIIRQVATNMEMEICRKATSRNEYISALNYELNKLVQTEISSGVANSNSNSNSNSSAYSGGANANTKAQPASGFSSYQGAQTSESMPAQSSDLPGAKSSTANPVQQPDYTEKQNQARPQGQTLPKVAGAGGTPVSEGSFMQSLLSDQNPMATYTQNQSKGHMSGTPVYSATNTAMQHSGLENPAQPSSSHGYAQNAVSQGHLPSAADIQMQQAYQLQQQQQQQQQQHQHQQPPQQQRQSRPISPNASLQEFAAQVQHFDKNALVELLWSQRNSLIQWQRRASQLEAQLTARYNSGASAMPSPYYNGTPPGAQAYGSNVPQNISNEAELQRVNMRRDARIQMQQQQQQQYAVQQPQYASGNNGSPMTNSPGGQAGGQVNPMMYWEKVRALKNGFAQDLYLAHRVLSQHNAAPNSAQSQKAENVKHNISLAMNVLNEAPKNIQPRPFEVLNSIERFIQNTIIPIVQKVQPVGQNPQQPSPAGPASYQNSPANASAGMSMAHSVGAGGPSPNAGNFNQVPATYQANTVGLHGQAPVKETKSSGRGKKVKSEQAGAPKMPPRAKQSAEGKPKKLSKVAEAKLAAQQSAQQAAAAAVRMADGHQSPFGAGVNALEKMPTPTVSPSGNRTMSSVEDSAKVMALDAANKNNVEDADDDSLNDFDDFPELDFDEEMPSMKVQFNKENNSYNTKKRSVGDV